MTKNIPTQTTSDVQRVFGKYAEFYGLNKFRNCAGARNGAKNPFSLWEFEEIFLGILAKTSDL